MLTSFRFSALFCIFALLIFAAKVAAAPTFPTLTGEVVDAAGLLTKTEKQKLTALLHQHETKTSNQVVVVTLPSLQGYDIADYGYQLGRHWQIGQSGKDNGVLLIVAPNEHKVRIEVGYGLEGVLTDKLSNDIIQETIIPHFKHGDFQGGILSGTQAILLVLEGSYTPAKHIEHQSSSLKNFKGIFLFIILALALIATNIISMSEITLQYRLILGSIIGTVSGILAWLFIHLLFFALFIAFIVFIIVSFGRSNNNSSGGSSGGGSWGSNSSWGGGGFSGGGGGFGGGGASGSW